MSNLDKIVEAINVPKRIVDGAEKFLGTLLGPTLTESGQLISDKLRYRRFKNQVLIFSKAQNLLKENGINPKQVNLKVLSPLIEYSSLEEDEGMQNTWAQVIANISSYDTEQSFNLKCIEILKEITPNEILLLDHLFLIFKKEEKEILDKWKDNEHYKDRTSVSPENSVFAPWTIREELKMTEEQISLYVDRLISFGVLKLEQPELGESSHRTTISDDFSGREQTVEIKNYELYTSERIHFTSFGLYFIKLCKFKV